MTDTREGEGQILSKGRLEALVDGVFAIAMTILVLEVRVPELRDSRSSAELLTHLRHLGPTLAAYFFSFFMLGLFWMWHHRLAAKVRRLNARTIALSLFFLALVSFFPFAAGVLGRYPLNPVSLAIYLPAIGGILLTQWAFFLVARAGGLLDPEVPEAEIRSAHARNLRGCAIFFLVAIPSALRVGWVPAALCGAIGLAFVGALLRSRKGRESSAR